MNSDNLNKLTPHLAFLCQFFVGEGGEKSKGGAAVLRPGQSVLKGKGLNKRLGPGQNILSFRKKRLAPGIDNIGPEVCNGVRVIQLHYKS